MSDGPPRMSREKPRFFARLAPWIGSLIVVMGASQAGLNLVRDGEVDMRQLGTGLLIMGGGIGLIARRTGGSWALLGFLAGALGVAAAIVAAAMH